MADDFVKGASGPSSVYDTTPSGLGLSPAYLAPGASVSSSHVYTTYMPAWTATGTQPAIGNGTLTGRYVQIGKQVHFTVQFQAGSTTTFGTGTYAFSLPVAGAAATNTPLGPAFANDNSAGAISSALAIYATSATFNIQYPATWPTGTQTVYGQTVPWTWATSDFIFVSGIYEAA